MSTKAAQRTPFGRRARQTKGVASRARRTGACAGLGAVLAILFMTFRPVSTVAASHRSRWSVDLTRYGFHEARPNIPGDRTSNLAVAASDDFVALGLENPVGAPKYLSVSDHVPWRSYLLLFGSGSGKLVSKCGPWIGDDHLYVWSTAKGNFLVQIGNTDSAGKSYLGLRLLLLSPSCRQINRLDLPKPEPKESTWDLELSPSRRTMLLTKPLADGEEFQVRDTDTLSLRTEWTRHGTAAHAIIAVSDRSLLATDSLESLSSGRPSPHYVRNFDGHWHSLATPHAESFLSETQLVGAKRSDEDLTKISPSIVTVTDVSGRVVLSTKVSGFQYNVYPTSAVLLAGDGRHFGWNFAFSGAGWLWGSLDMGPGHETVYIWCAPDPKPVAKIRVSSWYDDDLALSSDGSAFVWFDRTDLNYRRLPAPR